jgi:hypothetical protein
MRRSKWRLGFGEQQMNHSEIGQCLAEAGQTPPATDTFESIECVDLSDRDQGHKLWLCP